MLKVNGTEIKNVKFNGVDLDKVLVNGVLVFEKVQFNNTVTMRTLQDNIRLLVKTKDGSPCEVWNAGNKIGVLNTYQKINIPNKNENVVIKGKNIIMLYCSGNQLTELNMQGLTALQELFCDSNQLTELNMQGLTALQELNCDNNQLTKLNMQGLTALQKLFCYNNQLTELNMQGLTALQKLYCNLNQLMAQAFKEIFNSLLQTENGRALVYSEYNDNNYKDFTRPTELVQAFNGAKARGWKFYKNDVDDKFLLQ